MEVLLFTEDSDSGSILAQQGWVDSPWRGFFQRQGMLVLHQYSQFVNTFLCTINNSRSCCWEFLHTEKNKDMQLYTHDGSITSPKSETL